MKIYRFFLASVLLMFSLSGPGILLALPTCPVPTCSNFFAYCQVSNCPIQAFTLQGQCDDGGTTRNYYLAYCSQPCFRGTYCTLR